MMGICMHCISFNLKKVEIFLDTYIWNNIVLVTAYVSIIRYSYPFSLLFIKLTHFISSLSEVRICKTSEGRCKMARKVK